MKINKNQALYRALPNCWTTYSDSKGDTYKYACRVKVWNTKPVTGIDETVIKKDIQRRIASFAAAGGKVGPEFSPEAVNDMKFVEASLNEGVPDIICNIEPQTFYCQNCWDVNSSKYHVLTSPTCPTCKKKMTQLQMVYACECGFAEGVYPNGKEPLKYFPKDKDKQFKFFTKTGSKREMEKKCPKCGKMLLPKNATDTRLFYSQSGNVVNLFNEKYSDSLAKWKNDAEILMIAKWFSLIDNNKFNEILDDPKKYFEGKTLSPNDPEVIKEAAKYNVPPALYVQILAGHNGGGLTSIEIKNQIDSIIPLSVFDAEELKLITADLTEYDTLKYPKECITLDSAIEKNLENGQIVYEKEIRDLLVRMGVSDMQISEQVQIVNYAYGYTRLRSCPDTEGSGSKLTLKGFENKVFTTILETEGILVEMDMLSVLKWLIANELVSDDLIITTVQEAKKWFLENVNLDSITHYGTISGSGDNRATKAVYSLLHTISHLMIMSAGSHSGLRVDSVSELLFPNTCSFFIYPTSAEGVTLGSFSGMFESELRIFLEDALKEKEICTFDPVCSTNQNGACVACAYLSEVSCTHFNKDLSRSYLYGGRIKINNDELIIKKGFWK